MKLKRAIIAMVLASAFAGPVAAGTFEEALDANARGDYAKALHAEEEYRRMLTDYPDSTLVPQAKQRLRDVQEVLATREADIASYYATRDNYAAVIARLGPIPRDEALTLDLASAYRKSEMFDQSAQVLADALKSDRLAGTSSWKDWKIALSWGCVHSTLAVSDGTASDRG